MNCRYGPRQMLRMYSRSDYGGGMLFALRRELSARKILSQIAVPARRRMCVGVPDCKFPVLRVDLFASCRARKEQTSS